MTWKFQSIPASPPARWETHSPFWAHLQPVPLSPTDLMKIYLLTLLQGQGQTGHLADRRGSSFLLRPVITNYTGWQSRLSSHLPLNQYKQDHGFRQRGKKLEIAFFHQLKKRTGLNGSFGWHWNYQSAENCLQWNCSTDRLRPVHTFTVLWLHQTTRFFLSFTPNPNPATTSDCTNQFLSCLGLLTGKTTKWSRHIIVHCHHGVICKHARVHRWSGRRFKECQSWLKQTHCVFVCSSWKEEQNKDKRDWRYGLSIL